MFIVAKRLSISATAELLYFLLMRPHPHFTHHIRKKNPQKHPHFTRLKICTSAFYRQPCISLDKVRRGPTKSHLEPSRAVRTVQTPSGRCPDAVWISREWNQCHTITKLVIMSLRCGATFCNSRISFCIMWSDVIFFIFHVCLEHDKMKVLSK